jgi:hypothetical protein
MSQGALGDCWFLSAIAVCAHHDEQPGLREDQKFLPKVMGFDLKEGEDGGGGINKAGAYVIRFYQDGRWIPILIDDRIPCNWSGPKFASSNTKKEICEIVKRCVFNL